jgi:hypothetical protein
MSECGDVLWRAGGICDLDAIYPFARLGGRDR